MENIEELKAQIEEFKHREKLLLDIINGRSELAEPQYTFHDVRIGTGSSLGTRSVVVDYSLRRKVRIDHIDPSLPMNIIGVEDIYDFAVSHVSHGAVNECPKYLKD
jgi:hypothetical protein